MKTFRQFLTEAKIDTTERDNKIKAYLEKNYNIKSKNGINVFVVGLKNSFAIYTNMNGDDSISKYEDIKALNKNIINFIKNEKIVNIKSYAGYPVSTQFNIEQLSIETRSDFVKKIIKSAGGIKEFNNKYGERSNKIINEPLNLGVMTIPAIIKNGGFDIVLHKGTINVPVSQLIFYNLRQPVFEIKLDDNYNLAKNIGITNKISNIEMELFENDIKNVIELLNDITIKLEGGDIQNKEILAISSDLSKTSLKVRKNIKSFIKMRIKELENEFKESNEKDLIGEYISNLNNLISSL